MLLIKEKKRFRKLGVGTVKNKAKRKKDNMHIRGINKQEGRKEEMVMQS